jgi:MFS family permease
LFAVVSSPYLVVAVQLLDGVCATVLGVVLPLVVADITRGTGRFNLGLGVVGSAVGIGAALSTTLAGYTIDHFGSSIAFCSLAFIGACGMALVWLLLPETREPAEQAQPASQIRRKSAWKFASIAALMGSFPGNIAKINVGSLPKYLFGK